MPFGIMSAVLIHSFLAAYKVLDHGLISPLFGFAKGVELAIVLTLAVAFFLLSICIALRQAKKLPTSYSIEVIDIFGQRTVVDGLRVSFRTYSAAESYARLYRQTYDRQQYQFKVIGIPNGLS
jgi:hypothetical protein